MSYILESLKKSDQERNSTSGVDPTQYHSLSDANVSQKFTGKNYAGWFFVFLIVIAIACVFVFYFFVSIESFSGEVKSNNAVAIKSSSEFHQGDEVQTRRGVEEFNASEGVNVVKNIPPIVKSFSTVVVSEYDGVEAYVTPLKENPSLKNDQYILQLYDGSKITKSAEKDGVDALYDASNVSGHLDDKPFKKTAVSQYKGNGKGKITTQGAGKSYDIIPSIFSLDRQFQKTIPIITYDAHVYASDNKSGFVILNGTKKRSGEKMRNGVYVERVAENSVILSYDGVVFLLPAMKSWQP
jgi:hypothetical protein